MAKGKGNGKGEGKLLERKISKFDLGRRMVGVYDGIDRGYW